MTPGDPGRRPPAVQRTGLEDAFATAALLHADRPALTLGETTRTFGELRARSLRFAALLARSGVRRGDRIALWSGNRHECIEVFAAAARIGAVFVPINTRLRAQEILHIVQDAGCRVVFVEAATCDRTVRSELSALGCVHHVIDLDTIESDPDTVAPPAADVSGDDLCALMYTAAVDGVPRGAMMVHHSFVLEAAQIGLAFQLSERDTCLCVLPLYHTAGLSQVIAAVVLGIHTVCLERFDEHLAVAQIDAHGATYFTMFAPMGRRILDAARQCGSSLRSLRVASGLEHPEVARDLLDLCPGLSWVASYGQTETNGLVASRLGRTIVGDSFPLSMPLRPAPLNVIRILDCDGGFAGLDEPGEIVVRGPNVAVGYWGQPELTADTTAGGWHHTGDIGRLDRDGYLWFMGRKDTKELIKSGGENVYPAEVENTVLQHPAVAECSVIGVSDSRWMESIRAIVVLAPGREATADDLVGFCRERIGPYKKPSSVLFVDALPRGSDGRVDRAAVKASFGGIRWSADRAAGSDSEQAGRT